MILNFENIKLIKMAMNGEIDISPLSLYEYKTYLIDKQHKEKRFKQKLKNENGRYVIKKDDIFGRPIENNCPICKVGKIHQVDDVVIGNPNGTCCKTTKPVCSNCKQEFYEDYFEGKTYLFAKK